MLKVENLHASINDQEVLKGVDLEIEQNETFVLFGPNGSGKTTLLMILMGFSGYTVTQGKIIFKDKDVTQMTLDERARLGMGMSFQRPPTINGLSLSQLVQYCAQNESIDVQSLAREVHLEQLLNRDINAGFSGGEIKRSELLQLMAQQPKLLLFDEPESGVDLENMVLIGNMVSKLLQQDYNRKSVKSIREQKESRNRSALIITHTGHILDYINADKGTVMYEGRLCCTSRPRDILNQIRDYGYEECARCLQ